MSNFVSRLHNTSTFQAGNAVSNKCGLSEQASMHDLQCCNQVCQDSCNITPVLVPAHAAVSLAVARLFLLQRSRAGSIHGLRPPQIRNIRVCQQKGIPQLDGLYLHLWPPSLLQRCQGQSAVALVSPGPHQHHLLSSQRKLLLHTRLTYLNGCSSGLIQYLGVSHIKGLNTL